MVHEHGTHRAMRAHLVHYQCCFNQKEDMNGDIRMNRQKASIASLLLLASASTMATEGGGGIYPNGVENYMVGALPPPGTYYLLYGSRYEANTLQNNTGDKVPIDFSVNATAIAPRIVWVTNQQVFGGQLALHAIAPLVNLKVSAAGANGSDSGLGDMTFGAGLGYHLSSNLHYVVAVDVNAPTGSYNKNAVANVGRNYWNIEPLFAVNYMQPSGFNGDLKFMYDFNATNKDTHYHSGQELHVDFAAGWSLSNGWTVGVGGYVYQQTTDDKASGVTVVDNRGRALALGPSIKYDSGQGWFVTAKYEKESSVRNRAEGGGLKIKAILPF